MYVVVSFCIFLSVSIHRAWERQDRSQGYDDYDLYFDVLIRPQCSAIKFVNTEAPASTCNANPGKMFRA